MARSSAVFVLFALLAATIVTAYNQTLEEENATCDNNCFFNSFPGGSCTNDPQCMCDKQEYREAYFCCTGKNCNPYVMPDAVTRAKRACAAWHMTFSFDSEAACGIKLSSSAGVLVPAPTTTAATTSSISTNNSKPSTASASTTSTASTMVTTGASSAGNQTTSGSSTPTPTNAASGNGVMLSTITVLVAVSAGMLC